MATVAFAGGVAGVDGFGSWDRIVFSVGAPWTAGSTWTVAGTSTQGDFTFGIGNLGSDRGVDNYRTGFVMGKRIYIGQVGRVTFSAINNPFGWNQQDIGAGYFLVLSQQGQQDDVNGLGNFQGRLAVLGRYNTQIWSVNADPTQFTLIQTLRNVGTAWGRSVEGLGGGELDLIFLSDAGLRGLRPLVTTLNATAEDVGAPIDSLVRAALTTSTNNIAVVEPRLKLFWVALGQAIYSLSNFPSSKIQAWTKLEPRNSDTQALFTPTDFAVFQNQVFARGDDGKVYVYGGVTPSAPTYDAATITAKTPWLDNKNPGSRKASESIGAAFAGEWSLSASMQPAKQAETVREVSNEGGDVTPSEVLDSTVDLTIQPYTDQGTHIQIVATSSTPGTYTNPTKLSLIQWLYD